MAATRLVLHTKLTGEIFLSIFMNKVEKFAEIPMGTDAKKAREKARAFIDAMRDADDFTDQIT